MASSGCRAVGIDGHLRTPEDRKDVRAPAWKRKERLTFTRIAVALLAIELIITVLRLHREVNGSVERNA